MTFSYHRILRPCEQLRKQIQHTNLCCTYFLSPLVQVYLLQPLYSEHFTALGILSVYTCLVALNILQDQVPEQQTSSPEKQQFCQDPSKRMKSNTYSWRKPYSLLPVA